MQKKEKEFVQTEKRSRWVVASAFSVLVWCAWWYSRGGSQGLFITTCVLAGLAILLPRPLPSVTRWVVWTWVGVTVILFAANVARLMPPDNNAVYYDHIMDRVITAFYAVGVATLFFRMTGSGVSTIIISVLPMIMLTLSRADGVEAWLNGTWNALLVGFLFLATTCDQLSQVLRPRDFDQRPFPFWREIGLRYGLLAMMLVMGITLRYPVEQSVVFVQKQLLGLVTRSMRANNRSRDLSLTRRLPTHFDKRMRVVMLIQGSEVPGYLREAVYTDYQNGRWIIPKQTHALIARPNETGMGRKVTYPLLRTKQGDAATNNVWRVEVQAPRLLQAFCLPGHVQALTCEEKDYVTDDNGIVRSEQVIPERYEVVTLAGQLGPKAYPLPEGRSDATYLAIPPLLAGAVSNWITTCDGFVATIHPIEAGRLLERYFQSNFVYRIDAGFKRYPDPLLQFMEKREGFCVHFASAATLMLRAHGIPARVVSGFASFRYDPWLKRWVVREREGHSWVELWDKSQMQWFVMDPTPASGRPSAYGGAHVLRRALDFVITGWTRFIVWIKTANFLVILAEAGVWCFDLLYHFICTPLGWLMMLLVSGGLWWQHRRRLLRMSPEERYRLRLVQQMQRRMKKSVPVSLRRLETESWSGWLRRIEGKLPDETYQELQCCVEAYQCLRYRTVTEGAFPIH